MSEIFPETPGQARREDWFAVLAFAAYTDRPNASEAFAAWQHLSERTRVNWRATVDAVRMAAAAQEPHAAEVEAAFAGGMRVRTAPCPVESHDGEHLQYRTGEHWLCAIMLAGMLVAADVIADPAPELAARRLSQQPLIAVETAT